MLLFIHIVLKYKRLSQSFNTSHVVIYQVIWLTHAFRIRVSIHLMLLFIKKWKNRDLCLIGFNTSHVVIYRKHETYQFR